MISKKQFQEYCREENIVFSENLDLHYKSDASFLTLGTPFALVFPKNDSEVKKIVSYAAQHNLAITPRAMGSSTAGAALADENSILMVVDRLGVCDKWGVRQRKPKITIVDGDLQPTGIKENDDRALYAIVGGGLSTDELDRYLKESEEVSVIIAIAGLSAALPGVIASKTEKPVIGVPVSGKLLGMDALLSMVQMPSGVPVGVVGIDSGKNAALLALRMLKVKKL